MEDPEGLLKTVGNTEMGTYKLTSVKDLPADAIVIAYIRQAVALNEVAIRGPVKRDKKPIQIDHFKRSDFSTEKEQDSRCSL